MIRKAFEACSNDMQVLTGEPSIRPPVAARRWEYSAGPSKIANTKASTAAHRKVNSAARMSFRQIGSPTRNGSAKNSERCRSPSRTTDCHRRF
jgi:hypothetical protein